MNKSGARVDIRVGLPARAYTGIGPRLGEHIVQLLLRDRTTYRVPVTQSAALFGGKRTVRSLEQLEAWRTQY